MATRTNRQTPEDTEMTTRTSRPTREGGTGTARHLALSQPRLPRWAGWLVAALSAAAAALISMSLDWNVVGGTVLAVALFAVALPTWSRLVENSRAAKDRLVTTLVW